MCCTSEGCWVEDQTVIALNTIHIDVANYIVGATVSDRAFRQSWAELEWENKLSVNTEISDLAAYLHHIMGITNMALLAANKVG